MEQFLLPLLGGVLIGIAVSLMLFLNGRVTGVSGIVNGVLFSKKGDGFWRLSFVVGLLAGGFILRFFFTAMFIDISNRGFITTIIGGLLVGFGTIMGSGCTSGHGICGLSRFSGRSLVATVIFMIFGIIAATIFRFYFGSAL